ncbi:hypothetical protein, partial [Pantoea dispersa]|uniref:hypothetical protein n=1 Tax=Pantoea dispersa TaxID=59814 RepID=UPI001C655B0D
VALLRGFGIGDWGLGIGGGIPVRLLLPVAAVFAFAAFCERDFRAGLITRVRHTRHCICRNGFSRDGVTGKASSRLTPLLRVRPQDS